MSARGSGARYRLSIYASGDGDDGCPRVSGDTGASVAAPAWSRAHQTCRKRPGRRWACMLGWKRTGTSAPFIGTRANAPPLPSPGGERGKMLDTLIIPPGGVLPETPNSGQAGVQSAQETHRDGRCLSLSPGRVGFVCPWSPGTLHPSGPGSGLQTPRSERCFLNCSSPGAPTPNLAFQAPQGLGLTQQSVLLDAHFHAVSHPLAWGPAWLRHCPRRLLETPWGTNSRKIHVACWESPQQGNGR